MSTYEVTASLIIHCEVKITVEAENKEDAIDQAVSLMPAPGDRGTSARWKAKVDLRPPKGVRIEMVRATHIEGASGFEKARKI